MRNEDPSRDLAQDLGYDEDGSAPSERDLEDTAEARLRDELRAARREELWRRMVEFLSLFTWWA
jgi:hypothetical protein